MTDTISDIPQLPIRCPTQLDTELGTELGCHAFVYYPSTRRVYPDGYYPPPGPGPTQNSPGISDRVPGYRYDVQPSLIQNLVQSWGATRSFTTRVPGVFTRTGTTRHPVRVRLKTRRGFRTGYPGTRLATCLRGQHG